MTITLKSNPDGVSGAIQVNGNDAVVFGTQGITQGAPFSFRNKIINGKMDIAQRGASFISGTNTYTIDRWLVDYVADGGATTTRTTDVPSSNEFQNSLRLTVNTADTSIAAAQYARFEQKIEGYNARDLIGKTFTLSFWARSSKTGIHCVALRNSGPDRSYVAEYTINAANTWEWKNITVAGGLPTAGTWNWTNGAGLQASFVMACGSTFQTTAGAWQTGNFLATVNQVNCLDTVGNIFAITGVQLEAGSVATPFEHRPYATEMQLCRWYTRKITNAALTGFSTTIAVYSSDSDPMRSTPSATLVTAGVLTGNGGSIAVTSVGTPGASGEGFSVDINVASGLVATGSYNYRSGVIILSSEL